MQNWGKIIAESLGAHRTWLVLATEANWAMLYERVNGGPLRPLQVLRNLGEQSTPWSFWQSLAARINAHAHEFSSLQILAEPGVLGPLRLSLNEEASAKVDLALKRHVFSMETHHAEQMVADYSVV